MADRAIAWEHSGALSLPFAPKRGRPTADQSEAIARTILRSATDLFLAEGFDGVSMETVAATAGVPKSTLYKRYADKRALLRAVIDARVAAWGVENSQQNWMLTEELDQRLKQYAVWMIAWARKPAVRAFSNLAASAWTSSDDAPTRRDTIGYSRMVTLIERDILALAPQAGIDVKDPSAVATALMAMVMGWLQLNETEHPGGDSDAFVNSAVDILFRGSASW